MDVSLGKMHRLLGGLAITAGLTITGQVGCASAQPPGFPNLDSFAPVPVEDYFVINYRGVPGSRSMSFDTPYNLHCVMDASEPKTLSSTGIRCTGDLPDTEPGDCVIGSLNGAGPSGSYGLTRTPGNCSPFIAGEKQLSIGQKITYKNVTCAVGAGQLTACLDTHSGRHGFVLKPSGSEVF